MKILVAAVLALACLQEPQTRESSIQGTVTRYGGSAPIPNVEISLIPFGSEDNVAPEAITDANGHFVLSGVLPGKYILRAWRGGYVTPAPGGVRIVDDGAEKTVTVGGRQQLDDVRLTLVPGAVVAGRVLDASGHPAIGVSVSALPLSPSDQDSTRSAQTNDRGEYRIRDLETGRYIVTAERNSSSDLDDFSFGVFSRQPGLAKMYFSGKSNRAQAEPLELSEGTVLSDIDFTLLSAEQPARGATFTVSGKLTSHGASLAGLYLSDLLLVPRPIQKANDPIRYYSDDQGYFTGWFATAKGNKADKGKAGEESSFAFEFDNVRAGSYDLFIATGSSSDAHNCCDVVGRTPLEVNGDVKGITVVAGGVEVRGEVVVKGSNGKPPILFSMALLPEDIRTRMVKPGTSGEFTIPAVLPGVWRVLIDGIPPDLVLSEVRQNDKSVADSRVIVGDRRAEPLQVVLSATGSIAGIVRQAEGQAVPVAEVLLIPTGSNEANDLLYLSTTSDGVGRFTLPSVAVGEYRILALEPPARDERGALVADPPTGARLRTMAAPYKAKGVAVTIRTDSTPADIALVPIPRAMEGIEKGDPASTGQ